MNILIVDDHPMTVEGYKNVLLKNKLSESDPIFTIAHSCRDAIKAIKEAKQNPFNLAIMDQGLPSYPEGAITSGSDLALCIKKEIPDCKVIMITAHTEVLIIYEIFKNIKPDGLVIKNDLGPDNLQEIVVEVLEGNNYRSPMVKNCIQEIWKKELMVEDFNRQILFYLSKGFMVKDLEGIVKLSKSAIQKRIIKMKSAFDVMDDNGLVKEVIKQGFI